MRSLRSLLLFGPFLAAACGDSTGLLRATNLNVVDTVSLYAVSGGTPPRTPSGYWLGIQDNPPHPVLIQDGGAFDFVVDLDSAYRPLLKPTGALRLGRNSGVQTTTLPFDSIRIAPTGGYQLDSAVTVDVGGRAIVHSRTAQCSFGFTTLYYAKLHILAVDSASRRIDFEILVDDNCGYRGLELGLPSH